MSQDIRKRIAKNVSYYRQRKKLNKETLSLALGFDNSYISKLERAAINITIDKLAKIGKFLDIDVVDLLK